MFKQLIDRAEGMKALGQQHTDRVWRIVLVFLRGLGLCFYISVLFDSLDSVHLHNQDGMCVIKEILLVRKCTYSHFHLCE